MIENIDWEAMRGHLFSTSKVLGLTFRKHQNWFGENVIEIKTLKKNFRDTGHTRMIRILMQRINAVLSDLAYYRSIGAVFQKKFQTLKTFGSFKVGIERFHDSSSAFMNRTHILTSDGSRLITDKGILERWAEHVKSVFNRLSKIIDEANHHLH